MKLHEKKDEIDPLFKVEGRKAPDDLLKARAISKRITNLTTGTSKIEEKFPSIRLNQLHGLKKLKEFIEAGKTKGYFRMPTGAGKTILFGLIAQMLNEPTLILVPNTSLLESTKEELVSIGIDPEKIGLVGDKKEQTGRQYTVMTYQSYLNRGAPKGTSLIVCDEVHRSLGEKTRAKINDALGEELDLSSESNISDEDAEAEKQALIEINKLKDQILVLGFTATPILGSKSVEEIHGELIAETSYKELIDAGILKNVEIHQVEAEIDKETEKSYLTVEKEEALLMDARIYSKTLKSFCAFRESFHKHPLRPIAFCRSLNGCEACETEAKNLGLKTMTVTSHGGDQKEAERALFAGEIDLIITIRKLQEGWNYPALNTVIWMRGTSSPASLLQGVGRAMRSFGNERTAHLFEADWRVSGSNRGNVKGGDKSQEVNTKKTRNLRQSSKAITFAQALALIGEDINSVIKNSDEVEYKLYYELSEDGTVNIEGIGEVCGLEAYTIFRRTSSGMLKKWSEKNPIMPIEGIAGISCFRTVNLYLKSDVDSVISENRAEKKIKLERNGTAILEDGTEVCGLSPYANFKTVAVEALKGWVRDARLKSIDGFEGSVGNKPGPIYKKLEVDKVIATKRSAQQFELNKDGTLMVEKIGIVCGLHQYAEHLGTTDTSVSKWVENAGLKPVENIQGKSGPKYFPLYLKVDVDRVISLNRAGKLIKLNKDGTANLENIGEVCGSSAYANSEAINMPPRTLKLWLEKAGIKPIDDVQGGTGKKPGNLYKKSEVDEVISNNKKS